MNGFSFKTESLSQPTSAGTIPGANRRGVSSYSKHEYFLCFKIPIQFWLVNQNVLFKGIWIKISLPHSLWKEKILGADLEI